MDQERKIRTEDGKTVGEGARVFDYYNGQWVTITRIDVDGWFDTAKDDGTRGPSLNGERVAMHVPASNPFRAAWEAGLVR